MINEILSWWGQQLLSLVPSRDYPGRHDAVLAAVRGGMLDVTVRRRGRVGALGTFPATDAGATAVALALGPRRPSIELHVPPGAMLEQVVTLPLAAERDPETVLRYEMDRLTPFAAEALYWTWTIERRDRAQVQLVLRLSLVLRSQIDETLGALRRAGLQLAALTDGVRAIPLDKARSRSWQRQGTTVLGGLCTMLAVAALVVPFAKQSWTEQRIEREIASLRPAVDKTESLRRRLSQLAAGVDVLATQRSRVGDPIATLAALTDILPDDTVLTDFTMRQRVITLAGQSAAAARLIPALAADPALRDPAFTAPVTRNDTQRTDIFTIRAEAATP